MFKNSLPIYLKQQHKKNSHSSDPFWDTAASELLLAFMFYLWYEAPEEEQNFAMVLEMLRNAEVKEDDDTYKSPVDILFDMLEKTLFTFQS